MIIIGSLSNNAARATATKMSLILKGVFHASNFIGLIIPSCSVHQMLPIFSGVVKDCIEVQEKKNKVIVVCSCSPQNVKLGIFTS